MYWTRMNSDELVMILHVVENPTFKKCHLLRVVVFFLGSSRFVLLVCGEKNKKSSISVYTLLEM